MRGEVVIRLAARGKERYCSAPKTTLMSIQVVLLLLRRVVGAAVIIMVLASQLIVTRT